MPHPELRMLQCCVLDIFCHVTSILTGLTLSIYNAKNLFSMNAFHLYYFIGFKMPPKHGKVLIGIQESFQPEFLPTANKLHQLGYQVYLCVCGLTN